MEKLTQLLDVNSDNIGLTCMQGEKEDHVTCRFAIAEPSDEVREKLNSDLAQKLREMINEDKSLEGLPSQESNHTLMKYYFHGLINKLKIGMKQVQT